MKIHIITKQQVHETARVLVEGGWHSLESAKKEIRLRMLKREVFVAVNNKKIVGLFIYFRNYSHEANALEYIVVSKNHKRNGVAKQMLLKYIQISRKETPKKQKYCLSSTHVTNKVSIKMHLSFGFEKIGILKGLHYGMDEIFFGYDLRGEK